jgi:hypothetical protein
LSRDDNGEPYSLHGLAAILLPEFGWYRVDPRGNRKGVNAQFSPPVEQLAFPVSLPGESDLLEIWVDPLPVVVEALRTHKTADELWENLPDVLLLKMEAPPSNGVTISATRSPPFGICASNSHYGQEAPHGATTNK